MTEPSDLGQHPDIQGAIVALDPYDGAIKAIVGGFDFNAKTVQPRDPGADVNPDPIFKPFYYTGAIENGLTAASIYNDAPLVLPGGRAGRDLSSKELRRRISRQHPVARSVVPVHQPRLHSG